MGYFYIIGCNLLDLPSTFKYEEYSGEFDVEIILNNFCKGKIGLPYQLVERRKSLRKQWCTERSVNNSLLFCLYLSIHLSIDITLSCSSFPFEYSCWINVSCMFQRLLSNEILLAYIQCKLERKKKQTWANTLLLLLPDA